MAQTNSMSGGNEPTSAEGCGEIVVLNRDLFFGVRIGNQLRGAGYSVSFAQDTATFVDRLRTDPSAVLGLIDLGAGAEWAAIATIAAGDVPLLAFGPHKDVESFRAAKQAGITRVVSNGEFHRNTIELVRRYARATP